MDHKRWLSCPHGFFPPVPVLSELFRRLFLEQLEDAFYKKQLLFPGSIERLQDAFAFDEVLRAHEEKDWVAYAKSPEGSDYGERRSPPVSALRRVIDDPRGDIARISLAGGCADEYVMTHSPWFCADRRDGRDSGCVRPKCVHEAARRDFPALQRPAASLSGQRCAPTADFTPTTGPEEIVPLHSPSKRPTLGPIKTHSPDPGACRTPKLGRISQSEKKGPSTPEAIDNVKYNARRLGFTGQILLLTLEERPLYDAFVDGMMADYAPVGTNETFLANSVAEEAWRLQQMRAYSSNLTAVDTYKRAGKDFRTPKASTTRSQTP